jgi:hypothetical protein
VTVGATVWVIADGYIPPGASGPSPELASHESACILNAGETDARVELHVYFTDREPEGPYTLTVPARRAHHQRLDELPVPRGVDYCCLLRSDVPIVVQHTRLDSRRAELALMSTVAYPATA